jgi:hypothetical protein
VLPSLPLQTKEKASHPSVPATSLKQSLSLLLFSHQTRISFAHMNPYNSSHQSNTKTTASFICWQFVFVQNPSWEYKIRFQLKGWDTASFRFSRIFFIAYLYEKLEVERGLKKKIREMKI